MSHIESMIERGIKVDGTLAYVPLTQGFVSTIDAVDVPLVEPWSWCVMLTKTVYAKRKFWLNGKQTTVLMHRFLIDPPLGFQVDHIDGNGLNNTRANLRVASAVQNAQNTGIRVTNKSGFKGVSWNAQLNKWTSHIRYAGKNHYLGLFDNPEDAHEAYKTASKKHHGNYGRVS